MNKHLWNECLTPKFSFWRGPPTLDMGLWCHLCWEHGAHQEEDPWVKEVLRLPLAAQAADF